MSLLTLGSTAPPWCDWEPPVDLLDEGDSFVVLVELPGISQNSINVVQSGRTLVLTGLRALHLEPGAQPHIEGDYGRFHRQIELPASVQPGHREVSYELGVLTIRLPKCPLLAST